jgi:TonB family protein
MNAPARLSSFLGIVLALSVSLFSQSQPQQGADTWPPAGAHPLREAGVTAPRVLHQVTAQYTADAMRAKIEGSVILDAVVGADGHVGAIHVAHSLDALYGLDEQAVRALEQWTFTPGMKDGVDVPVAITVELTFHIGKGPAATMASLMLPRAFSRDADGRTPLEPPRGSWKTTSADDTGWRINASYPAGWTVSAEPAPGRLLLIQRRRGGAVDFFEVRQLRPTPMGLNGPMSVNQLEQFARSVVPAVGNHGGALQAQGQTRLGERFWHWVDIRSSSVNASVDEFDVWMFSSSERDRLLQVSCSVLMPNGTSPGDTAAGIQSAGGAFVEMLRRLTIERLPG